MKVIKGLPRDYMPRVVAARVCGPFSVFVVFDDGRSKRVNLERHLKGPVFEAFRTQAGFARLRVEGGTIVWSDQADIAPETLYLMRAESTARRAPAEPAGRRKKSKKSRKKSGRAA